MKNRSEHLQVDPGTEKWVQWARRQLDIAQMMRQKLGMPKLQKAYVPEQGVLVVVTALGGVGRIRITGGAGYREWTYSPADLMLRLTGGDKNTEYHAYAPADWSKDYKTWARRVGNDAVLTRETVEGVLTSAEADHTALEQGTTFYTSSRAMLSPGGTYAVALLDQSVTPATTARIAMVAKWTPAAGAAPGFWTTSDVPMPPDVVSATGISPSDNPGLQSHEYYAWNDSSSELSAYIGDSPHPVYTTVSRPGTLYRVYVDPYRVDAVYVDCRYWTAGNAQNPAVDDYPGAPPEYPGGVVSHDLTITQQVWKYSIANGTWTLEYTHEVPKPVATFYTGVRFYDGFSWGSSTGSVTDYPRLTHYSVVFSPQDGMHIVTFDNLTYPASTTSTDFAQWSAGILYTATTTSDDARTATATVYLDTDVLFSSHATATTALGYQYLCTQSEFVMAQVAQVADSTTGVVTPRGATTAGKWRWGPSTADEATLASSPAPVYNKDMSRAYADPGVDFTFGANGRAKAYAAGVEIYDGPNDTSNPLVTITTFGIFRASYVNPKRVMARVSRDTTTPGRMFWGGQIISATLGLYATVDFASGWGFNEAGTLWSPQSSPAGTGTTPADIEADEGLPPGDITFVLDGTSYMGADTVVSTVTDEIATISDAGVYTVDKTLVSSWTYNGGTDRYDADPFASYFEETNIVPDECIPA